MFCNRVQTAFKEHACASYPNEACGLVVFENGADQFLPCDNTHETPQEAFRIDAEVYLDVIGRGAEVKAVLHSHTNGQHHASAADVDGQIASDLPWGFAVVTEDADKTKNCSDILYWGDMLPVPDLIGRPFVHGIYDCYSIVRDWYRINRGVTLHNAGREDNWWKKGQNIYLEGFEKAGFAQIDAKEAQEGDVFLMKIHSPVPCHAGVYLGNGEGLNHFAWKVSRREPLHRWMRLITHWLRYEGPKP